MTTYFIEPGDWESATGESLPSGSDGIAVVPAAELRKAIDPVANWFDVDGEENAPIPLLEVVAETAKMLVEEREDTLRLRKALQDIIQHHEIMGGQLSRMSAIRLMAQRALEPEVKSA